MKKIILIIAVFSMFSLAEDFGGSIETEVRAGKMLDEATLNLAEGEYLKASTQLRKAGNEYALEAAKYKERGLEATADELQASAKKCYNKALNVLDVSKEETAEYYKANIKHRLQELGTNTEEL